MNADLDVLVKIAESFMFARAEDAPADVNDLSNFGKLNLLVGSVGFQQGHR